MTFARETIALHSVAPDLIPQDAPAEVWNDARNVVFKNTETVASMKDVAVFPTAQEPKTMVYVEPFDTGFWVYANETGIWATDGGTEYDITPASWTGHTTGTVWTSCVINGLAVINASSHDPVYWDGKVTSICIPLPDWMSGGRCLAMRAHKNYLFAIGVVSEGAQRVRWSDAAEAGVIPQKWTPAPDNDAGFVDISPLSSEAVDGMALRDDFLVYKRESIWAFTYSGGNEIFTVRKLFAERGCAATNSITRGPNDEHLFIGADGDIYMTDGVQVRSVLDGRAQRAFYDDFNEPIGGVYAAVTLLREKISLVIYPGGGNMNGTRALVYDWSTSDISFRDVPDVYCAAEGRMLHDVGQANVWDGDPGSWDSDGTAWNQQINAQSVDDVLLGTAGGPMLLGGGDKALPVSVEKSGIAFGNPQAHKLIVRVWPKVVGEKGDVITFRVGSQDRTGGAVTLAPPVAYVIGSDDPIDTFAGGRFMFLSCESVDTGQWRMGTIDVEYRELGTW